MFKLAGSIDRKISFITVGIIILLSIPIVYYLSANFIFIPPVVGIWRGQVAYDNSTGRPINTVLAITKDGNGTMSIFQDVLDGDNYVTRQVDTPVKWIQKGDAFYVDYGGDTTQVYLQNNNQQLYIPDNTENGTHSPYHGWLKRDSP